MPDTPPSSNPPALVIERTPSGTRILLPFRRYDKKTLFAAALMILSGLAFLSLHFFFLRKLHVFSDWHLSILAVLAVLRGARVFTYTRGLILLTDNRLTPDSQKLFQKKIDIPLRDIHSLEIDFPKSTMTRLWKRPPSLFAAMLNGSRIPILTHYPHAILLETAEFLRPFILAKSPVPDAAAPELPTALAITDVTEIPLADRDLFQKPPKSLITHAIHGDSETFSLPRWGLFTQAFPLIFAMIVLLAALAGSLYAMTLLLKRPDWTDGLWFFGFLGTCIAILAVLLSAAALYHRRFRRGVIVVTPDSLTFLSHGPLRKTERHWNQNEISAIRTAPDFGNDWKKLVLISRGNLQSNKLVDGFDTEIRWLATRCRHVLSVPSQSTPTAPHAPQ